VSAATPTSFTATFTHAYPKGLTSITAYGNPGPWSTAFDPHGHPVLTPYRSVIDSLVENDESLVENDERGPASLRMAPWSRGHVTRRRRHNS
jgi:hypothetical protein